MLMKFNAILAALFLASPVAAQDLQFDIGKTLGCLDRADRYEGRQACVGESANACMGANSLGSTTIGMGGCFDFELGYWDDRLNASYRALRAKDQAEDADSASFQGYVSQADALRDMQRAWITFRDATCDYERAQWGGGTGGGPATLACLLRQTGHQTLYLEEAAAEY